MSYVPASSVFNDRQIPSDPKSPFPPSSDSTAFWYVDGSPMAFENIGLSRASKTILPAHTPGLADAAGDIKFLICAECDMGPIGWSFEGGTKAWLAAERVRYGPSQVSRRSSHAADRAGVHDDGPCLMTLPCDAICITTLATIQMNLLVPRAGREQPLVEQSPCDTHDELGVFRVDRPGSTLLRRPPTAVSFRFGQRDARPAGHVVRRRRQDISVMG